MLSAVASEARQHVGPGGKGMVSQSAVAAAVCRRTPIGGTCKMRPAEQNVPRYGQKSRVVYGQGTNHTF